MYSVKYSNYWRAVKKIANICSGKCTLGKGIKRILCPEATCKASQASRDLPYIFYILDFVSQSISYISYFVFYIHMYGKIVLLYFSVIWLMNYR